MKKALFLVLLYFVCQFVGMLPFIILHYLTGVPNPLEVTDPAQLGLSVLIADVLIVAHLLFWRDVRFGLRAFTEVPGRTLLLCIPLVLSAMFVLNTLVEWLALPNWGEETFIAMSGNVWGILSIAVGAPLVEELLFRGAVMGHLTRAGYSPTEVIVWSAVIFGVFHLNPAQIPFAFLLGLLFGWLYYRTGSLVPGMLCHFINNSLGVLTMQHTDTGKTLSETVGGTTPLLIAFVASAVVFAVTFVYARRHLGASRDEAKQ